MPAYSGSILIEALIVIAIAAIVTAISGETVYIGMVGTKTSGDIETGLSLLYEAFEAVENAASERWQNIFDLNKGGSLYHPTASSGAWTILPGSEQVTTGDVMYARSFIVQNICRDVTTKTITGTTDENGSQMSCVGSGGAFDPSTEKITVTVSGISGSDPLTESAYTIRWRNKVCAQTLWSASGSSGVKICPDSQYATATNIISGDSLELCSGGC